ncbi:transglutaminase-like domain-containing protein [Psychrobacter sp. I-STPA6b]|uniref:transglutaminase-like domain-containing protein n=1 Tax=Psychrobacter sp. I-STPA6b TaxID=2585718 RepID=UPI001D0C8FB1|nr:transglutaminase-like domain-containing protein [Psychrobacter sp. I-STPA6b]
MNLFFRPNPQQPEYNQATKLSKALSIICTAGLLNVMSLPAQAAAVNERAKAAYQAQQSLVGNDAYDKLINLTSKYELEQQSYQQQRQHYLSGRSIFKKTIDGITNLFTDDNEVVDTIDPELLEQTREQIQSLQQQLTTEQRTLIATLRDQTAQMQQAGFDRQAFLDHRDLILEVDKRYQTLQGLLKQVAQSQTPAQTLNAITALNTQLQQWQPPQSQTDVENLPWGMPDSEVREPIVSEADSVVLQNASYTDSQAIPYSAIHQWRNTEYQIGQLLLNRDIVQTDFQKVAGLAGQTDAGNWTVLNALPAEVQPADLAETPDVYISENIENLAFSLDYNPAKIYKWVHDNIEYIPTYGSIQGSEYCLETSRCNATDTASLLIALMRASEIPARYVYGTIEIPSDMAINWFGIDNMDAIGNLLGQGGIPHRFIMNGSKIQSIQLEHIWSEVYIPYIPSKGNIDFDILGNGIKPSQLNSHWIPLDGSYKKVSFSSTNLSDEFNLESDDILNNLIKGTEFNTEKNSFQGFNSDNLEQVLEQQIQKIDNKNLVFNTEYDSTQYIHKTRITPYSSDLLSPILPYKVKTLISDYHELPESLKHYFIIKAYADDRFAGYPDLASPIANIKIATSQLQGKHLALSFLPASDNEKLKLTNIVKANNNGTVNFETLSKSKSLPTNINLRAQITLDGEVLKPINQTYKLGYDTTFYMGYQSPNSSNRLARKKVTAGEYHAIGYNLQGISDFQLGKISTNYNQQLDDPTQSNQNSAHDTTGQILQAGIQGYFAFNDKQSKLMQGQSNILQYPYMSFGTYSTNLNTQYRYGLPFRTASTGTVMDIDVIKNITVDITHNVANALSVLKAQGYQMSANEHRIPEALFNTDEQPNQVKAISAVKALQIAMQEGQKIFYFNKAEQDKILPQISHDSDTMKDIANALNQGKYVTVSERPIEYAGWSGSGYILESVYGGGGAYMISGGLNGGSAQASDGDTDLALAGMAVLSEVKPTKFKVNFFGMLECEFKRTSSILKIILTLAAISLLVPSIREMLKIPELAPLAAESIKAMMVASLALFSVNSYGNYKEIKEIKTTDNLQDCVCKSGIRGKSGACWICSRESYFIFKNRKEAAESTTNTLGKCKYGMKSNELNTRAIAWTELANARNAVNHCFFPPDNGHIVVA